MDKIVYFFRHGESLANAEDKCGGQDDTPLTSLGCAQAAVTHEIVKDLSFDLVFSSDLSRAAKTASIVMPDATPVYKKELREVFCGQIEGMPHAEIRAKNGEEYVLAYQTRDYSFFGGESYEQFSTRVAAFKAGLESEDAARIAVFSHAGFITEFCRQALGITALVPQRIPLTNCSVSVFSLKEGVWYLRTYNHTARLTF